MNFKDIHIGTLIRQAVTKSKIEISRICNFLHCTEEEVIKTYEAKSLDTEILLRWSKLLRYDFFRIYTQHMILYAPPSMEQDENMIAKKILPPRFRKNIYTKELIDFILDQIESGEKTRQQIVNEYRIPKTTLHKWIDKYGEK